MGKTVYGVSITEDRKRHRMPTSTESGGQKSTSVSTWMSFASGELTCRIIASCSRRWNSTFCLCYQNLRRCWIIITIHRASHSTTSMPLRDYNSTT